jgi:NADH:ubiquinone oxidoreductase subunit 3 (subunit A)
MERLTLSPPFVFAVIFAFCWGLSFLLSRVAFKKSQEAEGTGKSYACGEDVDDHMAQPDYSQFFPFAFFFTIAHVATMIITAMPLETAKVLAMAELYLAAVFVCLFICFRRSS